ncbi:MAG TPA: hypothetical protein VKZ53_06105 [Candidatus Angelobacter sp.]|nr:hypothetical protein [Candidatus Angelobacter sp.]
MYIRMTPRKGTANVWDVSAFTGRGGQSGGEIAIKTSHVTFRALPGTSPKIARSIASASAPHNTPMWIVYSGGKRSRCKSGDAIAK